MPTAFVLVDADPAHIETLGPAIANLTGVHAVYSVTGADADLVAMVQVADVERVADVVTHGIAAAFATVAAPSAITASKVCAPLLLRMPTRLIATWESRIAARTDAG